MELTAASASASVCRSAYHHLSSSTSPVGDGDKSDDVAQQATATNQQQQQQLARRRRRRTKRHEQQGCGGCAGLRRRCHAVLKQQRTRLYILRRCVTMLLCWHEHDLSD